MTMSGSSTLLMAPLTLSTASPTLPSPLPANIAARLSTLLFSTQSLVKSLQPAVAVGPRSMAAAFEFPLARGLDGALIGTGIPFNGYAFEHMAPYLAALQEIAGKTAGIRRPGAASLDLAYVAAGRFDGFWEMNLQEWDIAAGVLLVKEAGGLISDFKGGNDYLDSGNIVCANPKVFKPLLQIVGKQLGKI